MLAIAGGKGGCGKTTATLGVARALARMDRSVFAVDVDHEVPDLHILAGLDDDPNLADVAEGSVLDAVAHRLPGHSSARVVPSRPHEVTRSHVRRALDRLRSVRDVVLLDCPAGCGPDAVTPLALADAALIVTTETAQCIRDATKTAAIARKFGTDVLGVLLTGSGSRRAEVARALDCQRLFPVPPATGEILDDSAVRSAFADVARSIPERPRWPKHL